MPTTSVAKSTGYKLSIDIAALGTYVGTVPTATAKAICKDYLDPDIKWADQDVDTLDTVLRDALEEIFKETFYDCLSAVFETKVEGQPIALKLVGEEARVELEDIEITN